MWETLRPWQGMRAAAGCLGVALLFAAVAMAGCAGQPKAPKPTVVKAMIRTSATVNPDAQQRASPLVIRLYELRSAAAFESADFISLFERDQATLGADLVGREEFSLQPGSVRPWEKAVGADVRFVGVLAAFRDVERGRWKQLIALQPNTVNMVTVQADGTSILGSVVSK
jgi:type VI secretion system protein VasD